MLIGLALDSGRLWRHGFIGTSVLLSGFHFWSVNFERLEEIKSELDMGLSIVDRFICLSIGLSLRSWVLALLFLLFAFFVFFRRLGLWLGLLLAILFFLDAMFYNFFAECL